MIEKGKLLRVYDIQQTEYGLGRHQELDSRSLAYMVEADEERLQLPVRPAYHYPPIPVLDQGHLGSCTGNAGTYALATLYGAGHLAAIKLRDFTVSPSNTDINERFAVELYHEATVLDGLPGDYPPEDTGSSGLGVCKALAKSKLIKRYTWASTVKGIGALLQTGGVMVGMPWYNAFFHPDNQGFIDADKGWQSSGVAGGHEIYWANLASWDDRDASKCVVEFPNSWATWGDKGWGRLRLSTYLTLRREMDVKQLRDPAVT